jgi:hypothetical protein
MKRMSSQTPAEGAPQGPHRTSSKSGSTVRPSAELRLPHNALRLKLFLILKKGWKNLRAELCPRQPKSVCAKARDLLRNLPHWLRYVEALPMSPQTAIDLSKEMEAHASVLEAAKTTAHKLSVLVDNGECDHAHAEEEWGKLLAAVRAALGYVNGEFTASSASQSAPVSDAATARNLEKEAK